jgi:hypothetical protein
MKRKWLAIGIILLFVGVTIAPTINFNTVKASTDDDLVEVTTQACGIQGYGNTTVKLTREQYQDLEQYLVEFRARLNQTSTREEAVPIFKDAVVELDKYGLLPKGMSVEQAQKLVTSGYKNQYCSQLLKKIYDRNPLPKNGINNQLCLVAGNTDYSDIVGPISMIGFCAKLIIFIPIFFVYLILDELGFKMLAEKLNNVLEIILTDYIPFEMGGFGIFGYAFRFGLDDVYFVPSDGWVYSLGLQGTRSISGSFYGTITVFAWSWNYNFYLGVTGFIGLIIGSSHMSNTRFFLGSAYRIGLSTDL